MESKWFEDLTVIQIGGKGDEAEQSKDDERVESILKCWKACAKCHKKGQTEFLIKNEKK